MLNDFREGKKNYPLASGKRFCVCWFRKENILSLFGGCYFICAMHLDVGTLFNVFGGFLLKDIH